MSAPFFRGRRVLVTGGAGFIGSHLVDGLLAAGASVRVLDDFSSGRREHLAAAAGRAEIIAGDVCDERALDTALAGVEVVLHLATRCVRLSLSDPEGVHRVNSEGTLRVLMAARRHGAGRVVYVSSSEVYGTAVQAPMTESHPLAPTTVYGATKLAGELYAQAMTRSFGLPTLVVRTPERDRLRAALGARGIDTGLHYPIPVHLQPAWRHLGHREGDFPVAEAAARTVLSLPMYPHMGEDAVHRVCDAIEACV